MKSLPLPLVRVSALALLLSAGAVRAQAPAVPLTDAALATYGARITYKPSANAFKNREIEPEVLLDGKAHTRFIVTGVPYTLVVELPVKMLIDKLSLTQSDYENESLPKDIEISFDGGEIINKTLDATRPAKGGIAWQDIPVGKEIKSVTITVTSVTPGAAIYGGLGDIALWTGVNVADAIRNAPPSVPGLTAAPSAPVARAPRKVAESEAPFVPPPGYLADAPIFVHAPASAVAGATPVKATLPPVAAPGEHPRLVFTAREFAEFKTQLDNTELGRSMVATLMGIANGAIKAAPVFPSPADTSANKPEADKTHAGNSNRAQACGFAYALTGDEKYAKYTRDILVGYAERYESYPRHSGRNHADNSKITFQRLSEAMWLIPLLEGYDYIYHSASFTAEDKKLVDDKLIRAAIFEIRRKEPKAEVAQEDKKNPGWRTFTPPNAKQGHFPNWVNFYNTATMMAGSLLDDSDMRDLAALGFRDAVANGIGADGMWGEGAINYQTFAMSVMAPGFDAAARTGIDLWDVAGGRLKELFDGPLLYAYPDGTMPGIGDSSRGKLAGFQVIVYDYGYLRYRDPRYAAIVNAASHQLQNSESIYEPTRVLEKLPEPESIKAGSVIFGSLGNAILRDDTKYALLHYGPFVAPHSHYDKLNLILFGSPAPGAAGDELGGEPVFHFYDNALHEQWTTRTVAHNTMAVDERSQMASSGRLLVYEATPEVKLMRAEAAKCYPNVMLDRTVVTTPTAIIDLYHGASTTPHTWDRTLRYTGKLAGLPDEAPPDAKPLGTADGYELIKVAKEQAATDTWTGIWQTKVGGFTATLAGASEQTVFSGLGPDKDNMVIVRQKGATADFAVVYGLDSWKNAAVSAKWLPASADANGAQALELTQQDGTTTQVIVAYNPGEWTAAGWHSDARVLYVSTKGSDVKVLVGGGKFAQNRDLAVKQESAGNYLAQGSGGKLAVASQWQPGAQ